MNRFVTIVALMVALGVGVASANKRPHHHHPHGQGGAGGIGAIGVGAEIEVEEEVDIGSPRPGHHHHGYRPFAEVDDEILFEELRFRGYGGGFGCGHGGHGGHGGHHHSHPPHVIPPRLPKPKPHHGHFPGKPHFGHHHRHHHPSGSIGAFKGSEGSFGTLGASSHVGTGNSIEGSQGALISEGSHGSINGQKSNHKNIDGIHKHQVLNKEKTFVKDSGTKINDLDTFHDHQGNSASSQISGGQNFLAAEGSSGKLENHKDVDNEINASGGHASSFSGIGASGEI